MALHPDYGLYLSAYNDASAACVAGNRTQLARALRRARRLASSRFWIDILIAHLDFIGWPIRLRPNGRYL